MPTVLITGAGRGLGLEFAQQYALDGWRVHAAVRNPATTPELTAAAAASGGRLIVQTLDVGDHASIDALAAKLAGEPIDVLINNAGTMGEHSFAEKGTTMQRFGQSDYADWMTQFRVNVFGPMKMAEAFLANVVASEQKKIVTLTSVIGSIGSNNFGGLYGYRSSKAAANAVMKSMSLDLARKGIIANPVHPGWVRTGIGGPKGELDVTTSITGLRKVIAGLSRETAGKFLQYDGTELPW
jgi:NAD(P)-dependent dehydrogenase (short-subunit alcohol dehydrogenase family)